MDFLFTEEQEKFREEIREFCRKEVTPELLKEVEARGEEEHEPGFYKKLAEKGWIGVQWPREYGGQGWGRVDMTTFYEEMEYARAPLGRYRASVVFVGETILAIGNEEQKRHFLSGIARGEITFSWCLTEPNAGSDTASMQTKATADGNDYVLNGQKIFISGAHTSNHAMVAARTDPAAPKHKGISLFLLPFSTPGVTVRPVPTVGGIRLNEIFFDDVRVPGSSMLGQKNAGFLNFVNYTLNFERANVGQLGRLRRIFDETIAYIRSSPTPVGQSLRHRLAGLQARMMAARWMAYQIAWMFDRGLTVSAETSMRKVLLSRLLFDVSELAIDVLGYRGVIDGKDAPMGGLADLMYRQAGAYEVSAGTTDIQLNIVALRGLGLPRG
ncbi:MAG: acyl-CoA dehydrogenase family protein [Chloroflexi bacterium]|nr:acyl-CoA dehydrogenase family protein [Chloroflexota bacterium]